MRTLSRGRTIRGGGYAYPDELPCGLCATSMPVAALNEAQHPYEKLLIFPTVTVERAELPSRVLCLWGLERVTAFRTLNLDFLVTNKKFL